MRPLPSAFCTLFFRKLSRKKKKTTESFIQIIKPLEMRGRSPSSSSSSSSKQVIINSQGEMEIDKIDHNKLKEEPQLSGAYIRNLVKQLTSSRTNKDQETLLNDQILGKINVGFNETQQLQQQQQEQPQPPQPPQQHKKQVRRRLHTTRPYQERLLNMAEARREIVTALKFHRASMKQANEQQQQQQQHNQQPSPMEVENSQPAKSRRNQRIYANNFSNYVDNYSSYPPLNPYTWPVTPPVAPIFQENNFNFTLPNQTLGLNLNFQDFNNLDTTFYQTNNNPSIYSPSSSSSPSITEEIFGIAVSEEGSAGAPPLMVAADGGAEYFNGGDLGLHPSMDDKEIAEIRSIGDQHQMEWNDTLNLVTSAWWFKFLKGMEISPEEKSSEDDNYGCFPFDEVVEFPPWLNANEGYLQQHLHDYSSHDYLQHPALPCMDIEEIEGMDGEWLA